MIFILPLGIAVYFWDRRNYAENLTLFDMYVSKISSSDLYTMEKMKLIDEMFYQNGYKCVDRQEMILMVEKKHFNLGLLFISIGLLTYFGLVVYLVYYRFFLKPRRLLIDLSNPSEYMTLVK